ncbi:MAG: HDOD domain-containing protein [Desulfobacteraceae bacterium]|nr:HDOD domain-containing protein [Desulfobacteraceae bacterium]
MSRKLASRMEPDKLPTLPAVAVEAIRLMEGEESNFSSVADLLRHDQVLTGRILHYANSAHVGSRRQITSISQALSVLGLNAVRSIILSAAIFDCFSEELASCKQGLTNFWLHAVGVAATAEILARRLRFPHPEDAYVAGLLHDLGKLGCYLQAPDKFAALQEEIENQGSHPTSGPPPLDLERQLLDTDHIETGRLLGEKWGFPPHLARVMWLHHQPVFEAILPDSANLPQLVRFADVLCVTHQVGSSYLLPDGAFGHEHFHFALEKMVLHHGMSPADIEAIMGEVHAKVKDMGPILGLWDEKLYNRLVRTATASLGSLSLSLDKANRRLSEMNRVLDAACELGRRLRPGTGLEAAAGIIAEAAAKAFGVSRTLCLIRHEEEQLFVGQLLDGVLAHDLRLPIAKPGSGLRKKKTPIEAEAVELLSRAGLEPAREEEMARIVASAGFLATFFLADRRSPLLTAPLLGELVIDFSEASAGPGDGRELQRDFEALALAAAGAVERLLLELELTSQSAAMAEANRKMEESQRQLFHSHRLATVGRLAAGAAHEINNPLTIVSLNLQLMERLLDQGRTADLKERLRVVSGQEERIAKIIQDLMSFARPTQPKFASASAAGIVGRVLSVLGDRVSMQKTFVRNGLDEELPAIMVDPLQIEQVFMNLFINASQAMPEGGEITIAGETRGGLLDIRVADTGQGIDPQHLGKIFDPFFTTKKEGEGTGLGLAICNSIVEHNGGTMRVQSQPGRGTTFTVSLPLDRGGRLRALKKGLPREIPTTAPAPGSGPVPILVVDDERILNDMLQESLRTAGYAAEGAYDGLEAIGKLREKPYRLLILDIRMPNKDGLEVLEFVKNEYPGLQVVIITALASKEEIKETVRLGAFACLRKPFRLEKVLETVARALAGPEGQGAN